MLQSGPRQAEKRQLAKRKLSPPVAPPSRNARPQQTSIKSQIQVSVPPIVPPRRAQKAARNISSDSLIIFEDADDEDLAGAAERAEQHLEEALLNASNITRKMDTFTTPGKRSSSAPTSHETGSLTGTSSSCNKARVSAIDRPQNTLRRAISGPVTPSSTQRQFVPTPRLGEPPKLMIGGRAKTIRTVDARGGKVGGLKALFEEKALVAQSMSAVV